MPDTSQESGMPTKIDLVAWANSLRDCGHPEPAAFLRSASLQRALALAAAVEWIEAHPTIQGDLRPHGYMPKAAFGRESWMWCFRDWTGKRDNFDGWAEGNTLLEAVSALRAKLETKEL